MAFTASKRKWTGRVTDVDGDYSDVESCDAVKSPLRSKRVRTFPSDLEDEGSNFETTSAPSLVATATATIDGTETPITETSSVRSKTKSRPKRYLCTFAGCGKAFDRPIRLQTHINSHTGARPYVCSEPGCDKGFFKSEHLKQHIHDKHTEYRGFRCSHPVHDDENGGITECGKTFPTSSKLKRHLAFHEQKEETTCSWDGCGKMFRKQETLQRHIKKDHLNEVSYQCTIEVADGETCGQFFATPGQLKSHKARAHDDPKFFCDICLAATDSDMRDADERNGAVGSPFMTLEDDDDFQDGILRTFDPLETTDPAMQLQAGSTGFTTYAEFQFHMKQCHPPTCTECGKVCKTNRDLKAHIEIQHPDPNGAPNPRQEKRFLCPYIGCNRAEPDNGFTKKGNLNVHINSVHTKERRFTCGEFDLGSVKKLEGWNGQGCGMPLGTKQALIAHVRTQHLGLPAEIGARTGLRDEDRKRTAKPAKASTSHRVRDAIEIDTPGLGLSEPAPFAQPGATPSLSTGVGQGPRSYACLHADGYGCRSRFTTCEGLSDHMELTHGWNIDDIGDAFRAIAIFDVEGRFGCADFDQMLSRRIHSEMNAMSRSDHTDVLDPRLQDEVL